MRPAQNLDGLNQKVVGRHWANQRVLDIYLIDQIRISIQTVYFVVSLSI